MTESPLEIIRLKNLKLAAKIISGQLRNGIHLGRKTGAGSEFEQYRHYEPGDDPKRIDWKLYARSNKYQVKESPVESQLDIKLIFDMSGSMNYQEGGIRRLDYAKNLLASLAYLGHQQGDILSLFTLKNGRINMQVAPSIQAFHSILYQLESSTAAGTGPVDDHAFPHFKSRQQELIIFVSDFLQTDQEWVEMIKQIQHPKKEIVLFQILGEDEISFKRDGSFKFRDLESGQTRQLDGSEVRKSYNERLHQYIQHLDSALALPQVQLIRTSLHRPISATIHQYLLTKGIY